MVRGQVTAQSVAHLLFRRLFPRCSTPAQALATFSSLTLARGAPNLCHVPAPLQGALRNVEPPTISSGCTIFTSFQRESRRLSVPSVVRLSPFFLFLHAVIGHCLFVFGPRRPWTVLTVCCPSQFSRLCPPHCALQARFSGPARPRGPSPACTPSGLPGAGARERVTAASEL